MDKILVTIVFAFAVYTGVASEDIFRPMAISWSWIGFVVLFFLILKNKKRRKYFIFLAVLNFVFLAYATLVFNDLKKQINEYIVALRKEHLCAPSFDELLKSNSGWKMVNDSLLEKKFSNWGGRYMLRYRNWKGTEGFMSDDVLDAHTIYVVFPACPDH